MPATPNLSRGAEIADARLRDLINALKGDFPAQPEFWQDSPPLWAPDPFNGGETAKCGCCGSWLECVRPGKFQCPACGSDNDRALRWKAASELETMASAAPVPNVPPQENKGVAIRPLEWADPDEDCPICKGNPYWGKTLGSWTRCECVRRKSPAVLAHFAACQALASPPPSPATAGAEEPVAWRWAHHTSPDAWSTGNLPPPADPYIIVQPLYAAPADQSRVERLETALRPFADAGEKSVWRNRPDDYVPRLSAVSGPTVADFRRAAQALGDRS